LPASEVVMIGDDVRSDVKGAQDAGLSGVLVRTGKFQLRDLDRGVEPDEVLDSIADVPAWWESRSL
jgi:ribonucleotide monophosphatase NagD (HAD superfamily)